jgi:serine-type D-Ala-D-Ala carboxypeptidase/endopeptidase (penicillin-binding protein 4)
VVIRLKRLLLLLAVLFAGGRSLHAQQLVSFIDELVTKAPMDRAIWGIRIEEEDGTVLYDRHSGTLLMPASNRKLFSSAFAYDCLGPARQLKTEVWTTGVVRNGVLQGDLVIVGDGDPTFAGRFHPDRDALLEPLVSRLRSAGIRKIAGRVVADVSLFGEDTLPQSWAVGDLWTYYGAPADALAFNENVAGVFVTSEACNPTVTTDPAFVRANLALRCGVESAFEYGRHEDNNIEISGIIKEGRVRESELISAPDPALYTAQAFHDFLERRGIAVSDGVAVIRNTEERGPLARAESSSVMDARAGSPRSSERLDRIYTFEAPPLIDALVTVLDNSQNMYAETLLKRAAAESQAPPITYAKALRAEEDFLARVIGISRDDVDFVDGSGLSSEDMVTPRAALAVVRWMMHPARRQHFFLALARPGGEGTLASRLPGMENLVHAKTGYIHAVAALSGVVIRPNGKLRYFSIIANHYATPASEARAVIDAIVRKLAE